MATLVSHRPATELGSLHFNRVRMIVATLIMGTLLIVSGRPAAIPPEFWLPIMFSAVTGVVLGDFFLFVTMRRLGPRRTNVLFATNAVFAAIIGWVILSEVVSARTAIAVLLGFGGVVLAVVFDKRRTCSTSGNLSCRLCGSVSRQAFLRRSARLLVSYSPVR